MGIEPTTTGVTIRRLYQLGYLQHMESKVRFELTNRRVAANSLKPLGYLLKYSGVPTGIRTQAPLIKSQVLYLLSYRHIIFFFWSSRAGLNRRPLPYQGSALPTELPEHMAEGAGFEPAGLAPQ